MLKGKKGHRSHKRTKHSGMGGCGTPTSSENTSPCILINKRAKLRFKIFVLEQKGHAKWVA